MGFGDIDSKSLEWIKVLAQIKEYQRKQERAEIPMEYDDMSTIEVLNDVMNSLDTIITQESSAIHEANVRLAGMKNLYENIDEFVTTYEEDEDVPDEEPEPITPENCQHKVTALSSDGRSESVNCAGCGLLLSYKLC